LNGKNGHFPMKVNIGIVTFPGSRARSTPLSNLVKLLNELADTVYLVSGVILPANLSQNVQVIMVNHRVSLKIPMRIINYLHTQLKILSYIVMISRKVNIFVFFIGGEILFAPLLASKFLRKKIVLMPGGVATKGYSVRKDPLAKFVSLLATINFFLADRIVVYSPALIQELNVNRGNKMVVAHEHFIDFTKFVVKKKINERTNVVGYMGRFSEEKGILNLVEAIPLVSKHRKDVHFLLCGEGKLSDEIRNITRYEGLEAYAKLTGWISHKDVPNCLNDLKLLVLPSYTEGLPNVVLEAMACGTPVLATPVGGISDIIKDGETGFLLKSNDPKHIAERVIELLNNPSLLKKVSTNALKYVRENFSYEKTLKAWWNIFEQLKTN